MVKMILGGFVGLFALLLTVAFLDIGNNDAEAFEKTEHFHRKVDPKRLDNQLQLIATAIDRLEKAVDSLRDRVNSLEEDTGSTSLPDTVFYAYDAAGGQSIPTLDFVTLDTEVREDAIYVHAADDYAVAINSDGWYRITAEASCDPVNDLASRSELSLFEYTSSWAQISGAVSTAGAGATTHARHHMVVSILHEFTAGDSVAMKLGIANDDITTVANSVRLMIEKVK